MIKGKTIQPMYTVEKMNVNYRKLSALNYSMIKLFDSDPVKFYEQFKLGKNKDKDKDTISSILGDIVDFYLLECFGNDETFETRYDEQFILSAGKIGSGQVYTLAQTLFDITKEYINIDGEVTVSFEQRFSEAFKKVQSMGKYSGKTEEQALENFNKNGYEYYEELINNIGKTVIDVSLLDKARKIGKILLEDEFTKNVFGPDKDGVETFYKFPIQWEYKGQPCKSEIDILTIDHNVGKIYLRDLKTTYDNENFEFSYLKRAYYLQAGFYYLAVQAWKDKGELIDYELVPMEFIVGDTSSNNRRPIRYQLSSIDNRCAIEGFMSRGVDYKGVNQLVDEILWAENNNSWNCSKTVSDNKGILKIGIKYE